MPTYEYECARHGVFEDVRPMKESRAPQSCPDCGMAAPRVVMTAAALGAMPAAKRKAYALNERSAHQPQTSASLRHKSGCSCCAPRPKSSSTLTLANGNKAFPTKRPWMISH